MLPFDSPGRFAVSICPGAGFVGHGPETEIGWLEVGAGQRCREGIRGGGTKDFYGEAPVGEVLDTRPLAGITSYEPSELVVTVRAGTPLDELEAALAESDQCLAFEPPRFASGGTVGGMPSAGLGGPSRASVGAVR